MRTIYLNYAATTPHRSPRVTAALIESLQQSVQLSAGRNIEGLDDAEEALSARLALCRLFGAGRPSQVIFTSGVTASINMLIHGVVRGGDHVIATGLEHNAVARPLHLLEKRGVIEVTYLPVSPTGELDPNEVKRALRKNSRLLIMTHASNVLGTILPVADCFRIAKEAGLFTVLDSAQTAGVLPLRLDENTDAIAFTGHKGLKGLAGVGGFVLNQGVAERIAPLITGGTGSASHLLDQPEFLPDKFESGTPNTLGILSLKESVEELLETGVETIRQKEMALTARFLNGLHDAKNVLVYGPRDSGRAVAAVSISLPGHDQGILAQRLLGEYGILIRSGLHCAPLAHRAAGTYPEGTLRFSFGYETTEEEIDIAAAAVRALAEAK